MIPKKLHLFWGYEPMAWLHTLTVHSFLKYNPEWEVTIYQPDKQLATINTSPPYTGKDYFDTIKSLPQVRIVTINSADYDVPNGINAAQISDIIAYTVLYREGGVYCDFDVLWLKSWSELTHTAGMGNPDKYDAIISLSELTRGWHSVGILAGPPRSEWHWNVMQLQRTVSPPYHYESFGSAMLNRTYPTYDSIKPKFPGVYFIAYPMFYPYHVWKLDKLFKETDLSLIQNSAMCVHWFNGHPLAKAYINSPELAECSMTELLKNEGYI